MSFDSPLSRDDMGSSTEPLIFLAFLPFVPKSGTRTSALTFCRDERLMDCNVVRPIVLGTGVIVERLEMLVGWPSKVQSSFSSSRTRPLRSV